MSFFTSLILLQQLKYLTRNIKCLKFYINPVLVSLYSNGFSLSVTFCTIAYLTPGQRFARVIDPDGIIVNIYASMLQFK
jgi:hypothetical protein